MGCFHSRNLNTLSQTPIERLCVVFQIYGSVWPAVLPYCIVNVAITAAIMALDVFYGIDMSISGQSHSFMNLLVAFLLVSRVSMAVSRYNEARTLIGTMFKETREIVIKVIGVTRKLHEPQDKEWRNDVAYRALILLRSIMAVIDYDSEKIPAWEIPELSPEEAARTKRELSWNLVSNSAEVETAELNDRNDTLRVPLFMAYRLRKCLDSASDRLSGDVIELRWLNISAHLDNYINSYYSMWKFLTTPFPFPLIQMTRTFLLFYILTVPFALAGDVSSPIVHIIVIFFLTYGFIGLEAVSMELDDPFGDDPNDFDNMAMCRAAFNDVYLLIMIYDGEEYMNKLRTKMNQTPKEKVPTEGSWLLEK